MVKEEQATTRWLPAFVSGLKKLEQFLLGVADGAVIGGFAHTRPAAHRADVDLLFLNILSAIHGGLGILIHDGMHLFGFHRPARGTGCAGFFLQLRHRMVGGVHFFHFVSFPVDASLQVRGGVSQFFQHLEMPGSVHLFGIGIGAEDARHVGVTIFLCLVGEDEVFHMRLAFAGEGGFEIGFGHFVHGIFLLLSMNWVDFVAIII